MKRGEETQAQELVRELVDREGYETLRLTISNARNLVLTLDADPGPINIDDCTRINRAVRRALEARGLPADDYSVEVESPGERRIMRTQRHFERFVGERARVRLRQPAADGQSLLTGVIDGVKDGQIRLRPDHGRPWTLDLDEIAEARLDPRH
ncbi:MAG: hypothetical protein VX913_00735 [Planctomycetota bacterium]|nr:hypothetical protein [Planctomycetota bacterium]MEE2711274.1 hypothetical protein [Planctomycetota bacterium]